MAFIDEIKLKISAGKGGNGVVRWIREKYKPKGGPGGGNGGRGGDVVVESVSDLSYLENYRFKKEIEGNNGEDGGNTIQSGANGEVLVIKVPNGSTLTNIATKQVYDLTYVGQKETILRGGRGGLGNHHFRSSKNVTPQEWTPGGAPEKATFKIELKLIADMGLVGLPSSGKSTLLNALTHARSKVGAYHFTTLEPHLGTLPSGHIIADIPGLIEGASDGKGLGHKFLRHITRTKVITHLVSLESEDPIVDYEVIKNELGAYDKTLLEKPDIIILTKSDLIDAKTIAKRITLFQKHCKHKNVYAVSAFDEDAIKELQENLSRFLETLK